jgi:hypothetical protein
VFIGIQKGGKRNPIICSQSTVEQYSYFWNSEKIVSTRDQDIYYLVQIGYLLLELNLDDEFSDSETNAKKREL